ncbi:response regulator [Humisphaera borealis]|uniref:Response regulator n=1 Tax=Humisphaera borealis TaxID=2807512 RepID=A0A7M2WZY3_9BACT|nr:response regulator [Humisphaera borealis]QOV91035.1 response regulator [Humisphaera borealis]
MKILLVDDSQMMRGVQRKMLEKIGAEFLEAGHGADALAAIAKSGPVALIICDWNMPTMDGITFVRALRAIDKNTPIIMCTTETEKPRIIEALKAGVNNYLVKPFTPESFIQKVVQTLQKSKETAATAA